MNASHQFQAIVIGSGQGGNPLCMALARAGLRTALIERKHVGGTCVNEGCTPTKTMVASARVAYLARRSADYGVHSGNIRIDMERVAGSATSWIAFRARNEEGLRHTGKSGADFRRSEFYGSEDGARAAEGRRATRAYRAREFLLMRARGRLCGDRRA